MRATIWHPLNTDPSDRHRWTPRLWLPVYDLLAITLGVYAIVWGSPLLNRLFPNWLTDAAGVAMTVGAVGCLIGVCFPRLGLVELAGKLVLVFLLGAYAGTVATLSHADEPNGFVVIVLVMALWVLLPRVTVLFEQVPRVRSERRSRRQ